MLTLRDKAIRLLASWIPEILSKQDDHGVFWPDHGRPVRFNSDFQQFGYYPLAFLYLTSHPENPFAGDERLLKAAERSIRNNLAITNDYGESLASSHDLEPAHYANNWRAFSWLRTVELLREHIDQSLIDQCEIALCRVKGAMEARARRDVAEDRFARRHNVRNHPTWVLLAAHCLARHFEDADLRDWTAGQLDRVCEVQHPAGLWMEHEGPVVVYQHITLSSLSHYYHLSRSPVAFTALQRALGFHRLMTYPNGVPVETIDGRARYTGYPMSILPAAWAEIPEGAAYLNFLLDKLLAQPMGGRLSHSSLLAGAAVPDAVHPGSTTLSLGGRGWCSRRYIAGEAG